LAILYFSEKYGPEGKERIHGSLSIPFFIPFPFLHFPFPKEIKPIWLILYAFLALTKIRKLVPVGPFFYSPGKLI